MSDTFDNSNLYEGLFLISQQAVGTNLGDAIEHVRQIMDRAGAEVLTLRKWDDRKLAYPIKGQKRGVFLLSMFRVDGGKLADLERDCNLSEQVLRVMVTRCDHYGQVEFDAELEAAKNTAVEQKLRDDEPSSVNDDEVDADEEAVEAAAE